MNNHLRKAKILYDGKEEGFASATLEYKCVNCKNIINFKVVEGRNINRISEHVLKCLLSQLRNIKCNEVAGVKFYKVDGLPLKYLDHSCEKCGAESRILFGAGEYQPTRYMSILVGIFDNSPVT